MRKLKAKQLRMNDVVINKGMVVRIERDNQVVGVTYEDGSRARYQQNARLVVQTISDQTEEDES